MKESYRSIILFAGRIFYGRMFAGGPWWPRRRAVWARQNIAHQLTPLKQKTEGACMRTETGTPYSLALIAFSDPIKQSIGLEAATHSLPANLAWPTTKRKPKKMTLALPQIQNREWQNENVALS